MSRGSFITFEGGEGAGKSTQIKRLADHLAASGREVLLTREPGGSPGAEAVRTLLLQGSTDRWSATTEVLLVNAARQDHLETVIRPALARGAWVLCDRFMDSTCVYQSAAGNADPAFLEVLNGFVIQETQPDVTFLLDVPVDIGLARAGVRDGENQARFERMGQAFHTAIRQGFLDLASQTDRIVIIDATQEAEAVASDIWRHVQSRFGQAL